MAVALSVFAGLRLPNYLKGLYGTRALSPFLHFHGMLFTSWILLFVTQTALVAAKRTDLHRRLGIVGALLAVAMLDVGTAVAVAAAKRGQFSAGKGTNPSWLWTYATRELIASTATWLSFAGWLTC